MHILILIGLLLVLLKLFGFLTLSWWFVLTPFIIVIIIMVVCTIVIEFLIK